MIFQELSVFSFPASVTILDIKGGLLCNEWIFETCIKNDSYFINILTKALLK